MDFSSTLSLPIFSRFPFYNIPPRSFLKFLFRRKNCPLYYIHASESHVCIACKVEVFWEGHKNLYFDKRYEFVERCCRIVFGNHPLDKYQKYPTVLFVSECIVDSIFQYLLEDLKIILPKMKDEILKIRVALWKYI